MVENDKIIYNINYEDGTDVVTGYNSIYPDVQIPKELTEINYYMCCNCINLTDITIPEGVKSIGISAFYGCSNLEKVEIPEGVTTINEMAFGECTSLKSISIPSTTRKVDSYCFEGCNNLDSIIIKGADSKELLGDTFNMDDYSVVKLTGDNYKEGQVIKNGTELVMDYDKYNVYSDDEVVSDKVINKDIEYRLEIKKQY